ncbi:MAG: putative porin [Woeseiaceae bacterium]
MSDEEFALLREQLAAVSARLDQLEAENAELKAGQNQVDAEVDEVKTAVAAIPASSSSWTDRVSLDGDFRYRYERIDAEGSDTRKRNRIRARANIKAQLDDRTEVGFGLATGGDDPVSTNQTLGGGGSTKGVGLNLAYVDWEATDGLNLIAGKFKNPLLRVGGQQLTWDSDWTPEGLAVKYERDWFFVNAIGTFLEGDSGRANSNFSWGGQIGANAVVGDVNLTGGIGYYAIPTKGEATTFGDPSDPGDFFGNTAVQADGQACGTTPGESCVYLYDYNLAQAFGMASFDVGELPASVFFEYVLNSDASDNDTGWALGATIGQAKNRGEMEFSYYYADKQADSMLGLLTDSDFGGGGADSKGHRLHFTYGMSKTWAIGAQYFINEVDVASGSKSDYDRLMFDFQWKWK